MARIQITCPACGAQVDLRPDDVRLFRDGAGTSAPSAFAFDCSACEQLTVKPADDRVLALLRAVGVDTSVVHPRPRTGHPEDPPGGPPLTYDDLLDLHLLLDSEDWIDRLVGSG